MTLRLVMFAAVACHLGHAQPSPPPSPAPSCNQVDGDYPGCGISKSTYATTDPVAGKTFLAKYLHVATAGDECTNDICSCSATDSQAAWEIQQGRVYTVREVSPGSGASAGNGFGMHLVNVSAHLTTGGLSVSEVEAHFTDKLGDMTSYDSFMDYNVVLTATNLQGLKESFKSDNVKYLAGTWNDENGTEYTSVIVQVPSTQLILELVQSGSLTYAAGEVKPVKLEQRVPSFALHARKARLSSSSGSTAYQAPLVLNRAASSSAMSKLEEFYVTGMGTTKTHDATEKDVTKKCFLWAGASVHICYTSRPDSATSGDWKVSDFEDMLNTVHRNFINGTPDCPLDKWLDNHYAIDSTSVSKDSIVTYVEKESVLHYCMMSSLHYVVDPTGWSIQLDLQGTTAPSDCSSSSRSLKSSAGPGNPVCTLSTSSCPSTSLSSRNTVIV